MIKYILYVSIPIYYIIVIASFIFAFVDLKYSMLECEVDVTNLLSGIFFTVLISPVITIIPAYFMYKKTM